MTDIVQDNGPADLVKGMEIKPINAEKLLRALLRKWRKVHDERVKAIRAAAGGGE
jgi:hypothetical protein